MKSRTQRKEEKRVREILCGKDIISKKTGCKYTICDVKYKRGELWVLIYNWAGMQCYEWYPFNRFTLDNSPELIILEVSTI